ncbi:hypothetical protein PoB_005625700 [Plakobranchus ocellatus]|uniref:Uncharacterized protein n=1 Tax=Plakobranchus ocellatus TaxID=259542 RepID=A0AAV4CEI6_9GAST|nr:hypothetical protein PoB_005625700 [Plakobranchus ocellatus]
MNHSKTPDFFCGSISAPFLPPLPNSLSWPVPGLPLLATAMPVKSSTTHSECLAVKTVVRPEFGPGITRRISRLEYFPFVPDCLIVSPVSLYKQSSAQWEVRGY